MSNRVNNDSEEKLPLKTYYLAQSNEVELFKAAALMNLPILIKGPTGCGKTRFIEAMGEELGRDVYTVVCHDDLSAACKNRSKPDTNVGVRPDAKTEFNRTVKRS